MQKLVDSTGQNWDVRMTLRHAQLMESRLGVNVLAPEEGEESIMRFALTPNKMIDMLWLLVEKQAIERGITFEEFLDLFDAPAFKEMERAVSEEIAFFTQQVDPARSKLWTALLKKARAVGAMQTEKMTEMLESDDMNQMIKQTLNDHMTKAITTLREQVGNLSGSAEVM